MNTITEQPQYLQFELSTKGRTVGELVKLVADRLRGKEPRLLCLEPTEGGYKNEHSGWRNFVGCRMMTLRRRGGNLIAKYKIWRVPKSERR